MQPLPPHEATADMDLSLRATWRDQYRLGIFGLTTLLIVLTGCTSPQPAPVTSQPVSSASSSPIRVAALPEAKTTVDCAMSRPQKDSFPIQADDLALGPLLYPGILDGYNSPRSDAVDGITFAKIGTHLSPDATVTVSITPEASSWASIVTENGPPAGYLSVTYKSCPSSQHAAGSWWVGGFALRNETSGCLPLNAQVEGETSIRRVTISFWDKTCGS
ncbi:hypothetical protein AAFM46_08300 [Arthrobacter sp. TMP15]|uniref:hypothetical protein n=1 Tax=Arthrobacter sp. TMP15 TaxID=3140789 RepID=UPI0031BBBCB2